MDIRLSILHLILITPQKQCYFLLLFAACVSADAATLFCAGVDFGLDRILLALDATDGDVCSDFFDVAM